MFFFCFVLFFGCFFFVSHTSFWCLGKAFPRVFVSVAFPWQVHYTLNIDHLTSPEEKQFLDLLLIASSVAFLSSTLLYRYTVCFSVEELLLGMEKGITESNLVTLKIGGGGRGEGAYAASQIT